MKQLLKNTFKIISLGLGQQSSALYLMSSLGIVERADYAIFADTGAERKATYLYFDWLREWAQQHKGIPIIRVSKGNLYQDLLAGASDVRKRFASIPAFTRTVSGQIGMLRRQCSNEYKIQQIFKAIRSLYNLKPKQRTPATEVWLGITMDEKERAKFTPFKWLTYVYPFLNLRTTRSDFQRACYTSFFRRSECTQWLEDNGFPVPPKSACTFCPFQSDQQWKKIKTESPDEWQELIVLDEQIRNSTKKGILEPVYLHRSAKPLGEANLNENQLDLFSSECEGMCGL